MVDADELIPVAAQAVGEDAPDKGELGLRLAKTWLDRSTSCETIFTKQDRAFRDLLGFRWPDDSGPFSFDLGGQFRGGSLASQSFLGEVKNYDKELDLPQHFRSFLAKCYVALGFRPNSCDHFLWISWSPFRARKWNEHCTHDNVVQSLMGSDLFPRIFSTQDEGEARSKIDHHRANQVAERVWLLTLSHRQDDFYLLEEHYKQIIAGIA